MRFLNGTLNLHLYNYIFENKNQVLLMSKNLFLKSLILGIIY